MRLKKGNTVVVTEKETGRGLERGMPCRITGFDKPYIVQAEDIDGHDRRFDKRKFTFGRA